MRRICLITAILVPLSINVSGQKEGLSVINRNDLQTHMNFFASDEMRGRETGTPENQLAALYLSTNIMRLGLKPIPATGDFMQKVPLISSEIKEHETYLKINDINGEELYSTDSVVYLMAPVRTADVTSKFVFAGFGFTDTASGYDDFKDVDLNDRIVLIMTGSPEVTNPEEMNPVFNADLEGPKIISAYRMGARAILCVYDPRNRYPDAYSSGLEEIGVGTVGTKMFSLKINEESAPIQVAFITPYAANQLLKKGGYDLKTIQEKIIKEKRPASFEIKNITVSFRTYIETINSKINNVIGIIEGSDPVLKNECVIYTAHFDHIGVDKEGNVFNGADDNASGSIALLEVAKAFMNLKKKPLRTVVFAWVNGEEKGLLGSEYYTEKPVVSLEKTILDINLDMVGRSKMPSDTGKFMGYDVNVSQPGEILLYTDQKGDEILDLIKSASNEAGIKATNMGRDPMAGSSDYASFMARGIPAIFFNSGVYPDLHSTRDDVEKIDFDKMERVSKMVFLIGYRVANKKERFKEDKRPL